MDVSLENDRRVGRNEKNTIFTVVIVQREIVYRFERSVLTRTYIRVKISTRCRRIGTITKAPLRAREICCNYR